MTLAPNSLNRVGSSRCEARLSEREGSDLPQKHTDSQQHHNDTNRQRDATICGERDLLINLNCPGVFAQKLCSHCVVTSLLCPQFPDLSSTKLVVAYDAVHIK